MENLLPKGYLDISRALTQEIEHVASDGRVMLKSINKVDTEQENTDRNENVTTYNNLNLWQQA